MGNKNKPRISTPPSDLIKPTKIDNEKKLKFSFVNLDLNNKKYSMNAIDDNKQKVRFYNNLITKLQEYSSFENFRRHINNDGNYRDQNHIHPIDWNDNQIREHGFTNLKNDEMEQIKDDCWQLGVNSTTFRIHGYFVEDVFYVVWLDPLHSLYYSK